MSPSRHVAMSAAVSLLASLPIDGVSIGGCTRRDDVQIRVMHTGMADSAPIVDLRVFTGASKSWWPTLLPGTSVSVVLPPEGEPPQVTMDYGLAGQRLSWRGPPLAKGVGYAIGIRIGSDGTVTEQHCATPCALP